MLKAPLAPQYIGRFAPSPSGLLHIGSLVAALASYLDAKANKGLWYVRMEDLDPPRESPAAASHILSTLEQLKLLWDGEVLYQSQRHDAYKSTIDSLNKQQLIYPCTCSRKLIQANKGKYPGTCRNNIESDIKSSNSAYSLRCLSPTNTINFTDLFQGKQHLSSQGDFIVKRKDELYAYQLAVVVDDAHQNINHVIRGIDLMSSSANQIHLQTLLGFPTPNYGHIPIIINKQGQKLSKQHFASPLDLNNPEKLILIALQYLNQEPDSELSHCSLQDILNWGVDNWTPQNLAGLQHQQEFEP